MTRQEEIKKIACAFAIDEVKDTCNPASKRGLLYAGFVSGAEWADSHPHWISVEDALPPLGCSMIVLVSYGEDIQISEWDNGLFHEIELGVIIHPTHWMPMPEAPRHIIDANKKVDRVIGTADHIKTALDVLNKKGGEE